MTAAQTTSLGEVWMQIRDHKKLATIAVIQGISHRDIANALGWRSHSLVGRIMRGEIKTIRPEAAVRWAYLYGVPADDLFLTRASKIPRRSVERAA